MKKKVVWGCSALLVAVIVVALLIGTLVWWRLRPQTVIMVKGQDGVERPAKFEPGWTPQFPGTKVDWRGVSFADVNHGLVAGDKGVIVRTEDGGKRWQVVRREEDRAPDFHLVSLGPDRRAWVKSRQLLLHSADGGNQWVPVARPTGYYFGPAGVAGNLYFQMDAPTCGATVFLTADFGQTWQPLEKALPANDFSTVFFLDRNRGWVGKGHGGMAWTEDGGKSWVPCVLSNGGTIIQIQFVTPAKGWALEEYREGLRRSLDGGQTWHQQAGQALAGRSLRTMQFLDEELGFLVAEHDHAASQVFRTRDGGDRWQLIGTLPLPVLAICFVDARTGWAVGANGLIARFDEP